MRRVGLNLIHLIRALAWNQTAFFERRGSASVSSVDRSKRLEA